MKTRILLLLTVITFLTACESNDNENINITNADLIGTWNLANQTIEDASITITNQGQSRSVTYSALTKDIDFTYSFSENPNKLNFQGKYSFITTSNIFGQTGVEEQKIDTDLSPITSTDWSLSGNTIIFTENSQFPTIMNVEEFSANYLKLKGELDETETIDGDTITIKATFIIILEK